MIFNRPNSPNYYVRLYFRGREQWISLRTSNKGEANKRAARMRYTVLPKMLRLSMDKPELDIGMIADEYMKTQKYQRLKESTKEMNILCLGKFIKYCREKGAKSTKDINEHLACTFLSSLDDVSPKTHNNYKVTLSAIWKAIQEEDIWSRQESKSLKTVPMRKFTEDEIKAIMQEVSFDPFWRPACTIALYTGLRFEDIVFLSKEQIKKENFISLKPAKTERTGRSVYIPMHPSVRKELNRIAPKEGYFFPEQVKIYNECRHTLPMRFKRILKKLKIVRAESEMNRIGFHSWRVTFASKAEVDGIPLETIRAILGHTTKLMSQHYIDNPESLNLDGLKEVKIGS